MSAAAPSMRWGYGISRLIAQVIFATLFRGRALQLRNVPRAGGVMLVANHQSFFDPMIATLAIPRECSYMARDTLFQHRVFARVITYYNAFPVKRGTADMGAIRETLRRLKAGGIVLTFPEGTRTQDGSVGPMRGGVALLARKARVPIVPTLIDGAFEAWPREARWPHPHPVLVAYAPAVYPDHHPEWSDDDCLAEVRNRIIDLQQKYGRKHCPLR